MNHTNACKSSKLMNGQAILKCVLSVHIIIQVILKKDAISGQSSLNRRMGLSLRFYCSVFVSLRFHFTPFLLIKNCPFTLICFQINTVSVHTAPTKMVASFLNRGFTNAHQIGIIMDEIN